MLVAALLCAPRGAFAGDAAGKSSPACRVDISAEDRYVIRSVVVEGRWVPPIPLPSGAYSPDKVSAALTRVREALGPGNGVEEIATLGTVSAIYLDACVSVVEPQKCSAETGASRCVDIAIRPLALRVDLLHVGNNVLPVPRANRATFFSGVPRELLAFNPGASIQVDRRYGVSQTLSLATDLLTLPALLGSETAVPGAWRLELEAHERKSFDEPFYEAGGRLSFASRHFGSVVENLVAETIYTSELAPQGTGQVSKDTAHFGGVLGLRPVGSPLDAVTLSLTARWSDIHTSGLAITQPGTTELGIDIATIADARIWDGFGRVAVWADDGMPARHFASYQRLAGMVGYGKEFALSLNQTVGTEVLAGAGTAWGPVAQYARYFGGNSARNFLYDVPTTESLRSFPAGPLIRSFGERRAHTRGPGGVESGGTRYWHTNLNVALPIPFLSRPLIPDEELTLAGESVTLKDMLKNSVHGEKNLFARFLERSEGLPKAEAQAKADSVWSRIEPAVRFIADQANLYAVKPLVMADIAGIAGPDGGDKRTFAALGGGVQLTVVTARFEAGYMRTLNPMRGDDRGNFFLRLTFQNLF